MDTNVAYLPSEIPIVPVHTSGYAASASAETALRPAGLRRCTRAECDLRGDRAPQLLGGSEGMIAAGLIAREKEQKQHLGLGLKALGHLFFVKISGGIAVPPPDLAKAMTRGTAGDIWEQLRPYAEAEVFQGIDLPLGRVIFRKAHEEGHYLEELMVSVPAIDLSEPD